MKKIYFYFKIALFILGFLSLNTTFGQTIIATGGDWDDQNSWNPSTRIPGDNDIIQIPEGVTVTVRGTDHVMFNTTLVIQGTLIMEASCDGFGCFGQIPTYGSLTLTGPESAVFLEEDASLLDETSGVGAGNFLFISVSGNRYWSGAACLVCGQVTGSIASADEEYIWPADATRPSFISLPVTLTSFTASANSSFTNIKWTTASEWDFSHYEIEKSFDGLDFDFVAEVDPKGGEDLLTDYSYTDLFPGRDLVYYRLKMIDLDGSFEYSKVVSVSSKASLEELSVFPNPAPNGNFSLYYPNAFGKEIEVSVMNAVGMQVFTKTLVLDRDVLDIAPEKELQSGHYMLNVQIDGQVFRKHMIFH
ncbi:T9SS type A sorting domain-containing protein [Flammeovirgaceae bacterium SG7u.111]|nr:T9SS type A sorting domain-containing protein [Flammeovirgaceae bacterium SG7u.132]WPO37738.1 T9SS type A sorting domain-containing protein [Flammeovirgaceae bacterium SG7u.111]